MGTVTLLILAAAVLWFFLGQPVIAGLLLLFLPLTWRNTKAVEEAPTLKEASWETATSVVLVLCLAAIIIVIALAGGGASLGGGDDAAMLRALLGE